ncbi:CopD family protein [Marinobacter sp. HN1S83]|uniref:CopD family protein n=1 Tax=Marinobacter sp. HN1S83 TaxID=3382301 RepID=UPI00387B123A
MLGILVLHMAALLLWAVTLLYLSTLIVDRHCGQLNLYEFPAEEDSLARRLFTLVATPAALAAIVFGTLVFVLNRTTAFWLIAKLTLVAALVVCHVLTGLLILRCEAGRVQHPRRWSAALLTVEILLMGAVLWLVLAKPGAPQWLETQSDRWEVQP